jgi:hypothetical protein
MLFLIMNAIGIILGLVLGYGYFKSKSTISKKKGWTWAIGSFIVCVVFFNVITTFVNVSNDNRNDQAVEDMKQQYEEKGNKNSDTFKNLRISIQTEEQKRTIDHYIYVANYNKNQTFKGKVHVELMRDDKKVAEHTTEMITLKPGEKKEVTFFKGPRKYDSYKWQWQGELK